MNNFVIVPTYNEAENLESFIKQIFNAQPGFNVIIVDDNSPDGTGKIADSLSKSDPRISIIHRSVKSGLGTAYITGFKEALKRGADLIFEMDADFSHNPCYLEDFLKASENYDLVIGSRYVNGVRVEGWRFRRLLLSKFANMLVSYIMVRPIWDFTAGYRCYRRKVLESINLDRVKSDGYAFQIEMTYHAFEGDFSVYEIPILFKEREKGYSKISREVVWEAFWMIWRLRAPLPKLLGHLSFLFKDYREFVDKHRKEEITTHD